MADEIVIKVDESGNTLGQIMKSEAHAKGIRHMECFSLITDGKYVVLQQRADDKPLWPGRWDVSMGGHVGFGEKPDLAALREMKEELGLDFTDSDLWKSFGFCEDCKASDNFINNIYGHAYMVVVEDVRKLKFMKEGSEVKSVRIATIEEFKEIASKRDDRFVPHWEMLMTYAQMLDEKLPDILKEARRLAKLKEKSLKGERSDIDLGV